MLFLNITFFLMPSFRHLQPHLYEATEALHYSDAAEIFAKVTQNSPYKFLLESKDISPIYGRMSLIGIDPILKISGKEESFAIEVLQERGRTFAKGLKQADFPGATDIRFDPDKIEGRIPRELYAGEEKNRSRRLNSAQILRSFLQKFAVAERVFMGLYGGVSYDFIRLFEDLETRLPKNDIPDFTFFLYDTFILFDHLKQKTEILVYQRNKKEAATALREVQAKVEAKSSSKPEYAITNPRFSLSREQYMEFVENARIYASNGELFEVVFSNILKAGFSGDPFALYQRYRETNPSPYLFYFDFGVEQLVGASPEMMVRVENGFAHLRPISGTARRGADAIADHENMLALLANPKEKAELDMLIDLGRSDLSRVCEPGLKLTDYRFVEKYSRVMHTVAHLSGKLRPECTAFDALVSCLNAGTLTGAPKVAAMTMIERHEAERRGYYGGAVGYFTLSGEMDTAILIRTAHIRDDKLRFQVGATLLYDSVPEREYQETMHKAEAFLEIFASQAVSGKQ